MPLDEVQIKILALNLSLATNSRKQHESGTCLYDDGQMQNCSVEQLLGAPPFEVIDPATGGRAIAIVRQALSDRQAEVILRKFKNRITLPPAAEAGHIVGKLP